MSVINTNIMSTRAQLAVQGSGLEMARHTQKMSTGKGINSASDSASGMALVNRMTSQIMGAAQALRNAQDGVSIAQTADGSLGEIESMAQRMRELSVQSLNDTLTSQDREALDLEFQSIKKQMVTVTRQSTWNEIPLLQPRKQVFDQIVPAQVGSQTPINTSQPVSGSYSLFINGETITVDLLQGEPSLQRLQKITTAINAGTNTHGAVASINPFGAIDLRTPDGRDLAAAYSKANGAISGIHLGLGGVKQAQVNQLNISANHNLYPVFTQGNGFLEFSGHGGSGESISWPTSAQPVTQANTFSMVNGTLYKGNGTVAVALGKVDSTLNGLAGKPLRINLQTTFANGNFETTTGGQIPGWTVENRLVPLNGQGTLAGFPVPTDTTKPAGSPGEASNVPGGVFTASITGTTSSSGSKSVVMQVSNLFIPAYGVAHGPALISNDPVAIEAGQTVSFDWKAVEGSDDYDVYAYLLNVDNGSRQELLNSTGDFTNWNTRTVTVTNSGNYKFIFLAGAYDATGGTAVGASLYIDNVKTGVDPSQTALTSADLSQIESAVTYVDQTPVRFSVVINDVAFTSDPAQTTTAAWDSLVQKIAAQNDPKMANIQVTKTGDALTVRSTNPGQGFSIGALSTTSPILAMSNQVLVPNENQGDAISAIHQLSELPLIPVVKGQQVTAQQLNAARFLQLQVGANNGQYLEIELPDYGPPGGAIDDLVWDAAQPDNGEAPDPNRRVIHIRTSQAAEQALHELDATLSTVLTDRARLGASMNRLIHVGDNLSQMHLEQSKSRSGIQDTNFAVSASELVKSQIINQAAMSVLAQANAQPQYVMELLKTGR